MAIDQENIAIFWDFDSTKSQALNPDIQPSEVVQNIRSAVSAYGSIRSFRAYGNFSGQALVRATNVRSDLLASGLTLMDCPNDGRKDLGVKIMLVDVIAHAWDHTTPTTFVLITADRDIAYCISTLRMRKSRVLVICPPGSHSDLKAQASSQLDWNQSILGHESHEDDFPSGGDIFDDAPRLSKKQSSFSFHTPAAPGSSAGSYHQQAGQAANGLAPVPQNSDHHDPPRPASTNLYELHDLPARSRRNSMFSSTFRQHKFDVFGDMGVADDSPKLFRGAFGLGDGPLLPRSQSRFGAASRPDSVPPSFMYPTSLSKPPYTPQPEKAATSNGTTTSTWKEKESAFPILEPEVIAPQAPLASKYDAFVPRGLFDSPKHTKVNGDAPNNTYSSSKPQQANSKPPHTSTEPPKWKGKERSFPILEPENSAPPAPPAPSYGAFPSRGLFDRPSSLKTDAGTIDTSAISTEQVKPASSSPSTPSSSKASRRRSSVSAMEHPEQKSTAPTSADTAQSFEKAPIAEQPIRRDIATELLYGSSDPMPRTQDDTVRADQARESIRNPTPEQKPPSPKSELKPQAESTSMSAPQSSSTLFYQKASTSAENSPQPPAKGLAGPSKAPTNSLPPPLEGSNAQYRPLVQVLQANASSTFMSKATLGAALLKHDPHVYRSQTGSNKNFFKHYIAGAVAAGIIIETNDRQSVRLLPPHAAR